MDTDHLKYRGCTGSCEYEAGWFHGKVLNTNDVILYRGKNLKELYIDFYETVDAYIALTKQIK